MKKVLFAGAVLACAVVGTAQADIAVHIDGGGGGTPVGDSVHGWEFTLNSDVLLTHLGLWDEDGDGFVHDHAIGLFRVSDGALLTSGSMSVGTGDPLTDGFRYIDVADVAITTGENYVLSYYSATGSGDLVVTGGTGEVFAPEVNWVQGRWGTNTGGLIMGPNGTSSDRYGPNFMFGEIPAPSSLALLALGGLVTTRRRRRG